MERIVQKIFEGTMFSEIIYVDENPAKVEKIYTWKKDGEIFNNKVEATYVLSKSSSNTEEQLAEELLHSLIVRMNFNSERNDLKYFKRGLISRILKGQSPGELADLLSPYDWCIAGRRIISELAKTEGFIELESTTKIKAVGALKGAVIYQLPEQYDEDSMYLGSTDSITPVFTKESSGIGWMYEYHVWGSHSDQSRHSEVKMKKVYLT